MTIGHTGGLSSNECLAIQGLRQTFPRRRYLFAPSVRCGRTHWPRQWVYRGQWMAQGSQGLFGPGRAVTAGLNRGTSAIVAPGRTPRPRSVIRQTRVGAGSQPCRAAAGVRLTRASRGAHVRRRGAYAPRPGSPVVFPGLRRECLVSAVNGPTSVDREHHAGDEGMAREEKHCVCQVVG